MIIAFIFLYLWAGLTVFGLLLGFSKVVTRISGNAPVVSILNELVDCMEEKPMTTCFVSVILWPAMLVYYLFGKL